MRFTVTQNESETAQASNHLAQMECETALNKSNGTQTGNLLGQTDQSATHSQFTVAQNERETSQADKYLTQN
jgi:hypothetical protein